MCSPRQIFHFDCFALLGCSKEDFDQDSCFFTLYGFFTTNAAAERAAGIVERARVTAVYDDWAKHSYFNLRRTLAEHPAADLFAVIPLNAMRSHGLDDLEDVLKKTAKNVLSGIGGSPFTVDTADIREAWSSKL